MLISIDIQVYQPCIFANIVFFKVKILSSGHFQFSKKRTNNVLIKLKLNVNMIQYFEFNVTYFTQSLS